MARTLACHLLTLPRELRNVIYGFTTKEAKLSSRDTPVVYRLQGSPYLSFILTCIQVCNEYLEHTIPRACLVIPKYDQESLDSIEQPLRSCVPNHLLGTIGHFRLTLEWRDLLATGSNSNESFRYWMITASLKGVMEQQAMKRSCTQIGIGSLEAILSRFRSVTSNKATINVRIILGAHITMDDNESLKLLTWDGKISFDILERYRSMFHLPTFMDSKIYSRDSVNFQLIHYTPLYCTMVRNSKDIRESVRAHRNGQAMWFDAPVSEDSAAKVVWVIRPESGVEDWQHCWAKMMGIAE